MRSRSLAAVATSLLAVGATAAPTAAASATEVQLGQTTTALVAPVCPTGTTASSCQILLTEMTGLATLSDGTAYPTQVKTSGVLTSYSLGISSAANKYIATLDKTYGGAPEAELTVLRPAGGPGRFRWQVAAQSSPQSLANYTGAVVQFPLAQALPVVKGEVVALSTPTWAPVLSILLAKTSFAYRQPVVPTADPQTPQNTTPMCWQTTLSTALSFGNAATYGCSYTGTRIEYTATEVTTPTPTASIRLARRVDAMPDRRPRIIRR